MRSSKDKGEADLEQSGRGRSDSDADWEPKEQRRSVADDVNPADLRVGDILVFMIPKTNPTLTDRFIRFMQKAKSGEHLEDADAVHVAIVTKAGRMPAMSHYTTNGLGEDLVMTSAYQNHQYEIFRPTEELRPKIEEKTRHAKQAPDNPDVEINTKYSFPKMIAAFLKGEGKLPDKLRKSLPDALYKRGYGEHVCSTFVAAVIKDAQKESNSETKTVDTSFLVPSKLFAKLKSDNTNFTRILPAAMSNQEKNKELLDVVNSIVNRLEQQKKALIGINKDKIQAKIDNIQAALEVFERNKDNKTNTPAALVAIMTASLAMNTGSGFKQSKAAEVFLQAARKLGVDTSRQEAALSGRAKSFSDPVNDSPEPPRINHK